MKFFLIIGVLLSAANIVGSSVSMKEAAAKMLKRSNDIRTEMANRYSVANMQKLSYSEDLEKKIKFECEKSDEMQLERMKEEDKNEVETFDSFKQDMKKINKYPLLTCFHPLNTEIAFVFEECKFQNGTEYMAVNSLCGPHSSFSDSDAKEGKPGSECDEDDEDGLCVDGSSNIFSIGTIFHLISFYLVSSTLF